MRVAYTVVITLVIILNSSELSSQSDNFHPHGASSSDGIPHFAGRSESDLNGILVMRRYSLPPNSDLLTKFSNGGYRPIGNTQFPALITGNGYVIAKVERYTAIVRGIYNRIHKRVKIHAITGEIIIMEPHECELYPLNRMYNVPSTLILRGSYTH